MKILLEIFGALLLCGAVAFPAMAEDTFPSYELSVSFDLDRNLLVGNARIVIPIGLDTSVYTTGLNVIGASMDGEALEPRAINGGEGFGVSSGGVLALSYEKAFDATQPEADPENAGVVGSVVSPEGISLTGAWYPKIEGLAYYSLTATVPDGFTAVSEADLITEKATPDGMEFSFQFPHPSEGMTLAAGRYSVIKDASDDAEVYAYFFEEDAELAREYLNYARDYLRMYGSMFGKYPFKRFSVVENIVPTGYSMATFTLLGRDVVRLPFIVKTSLGHEILHQWFGNYVYGGADGGNWTEGLTSYLSDHLYEERQGKGALYRKKIIADYQSYVTEENAIPLAEFRGRVDLATRAIGYGKGAMVFHMLKGVVGGDVFIKTLNGFVSANKFRRASWDDIRAEFEKASGSELKEFFSQWLTRKDVPDMDVVEPRVLYLEGVPTVQFKLRQKGGPYRLKIKARVSTDKGEFDEALEIGEEEKAFKIPVSGSPVRMVLDPEYDIMRALWQDEFPPTISRLLGGEKRLLVVPEKGMDDYLELTKLLKGKDFTVVLDDEVKDEDLSSSNVLLLGADGPVHRRLFAKPPVKETGEGFEITVMKNPLDPDNVVAVAVASIREEVEAAARKIFHYGKYSRLKFAGGKNIEKDVADSDEGMVVELGHKVTGIRPESAISLDDIIRDLIGKGIIFVGESHTNYEDHRVQLDVIRALRESGRKFAIGMEMFQTPSQGALDDYVQGKTTEKEFLKASEYFKRWTFDYWLYREILQYVKAYGIPVIALNADKDIIKKVSGGGLDALSPEEREKIPADMDMSDMKYRRRLEEIFGLHENSAERQFQYFYQSQILWDETMAHSLARYIGDNPERQVVVLAGVGHVAWGHGIPKRARRLTGRDYAILINANVDVVEDGMADYVLFPEELKPPESPKLGVMATKTGEGMEASEIQEGSPAAEAGMRNGDVILSVDGVDVKDIADIKLALFDHEKGDTVVVKILRKRFLLGKKEMAIEVTLK